jgi:hypothetical protein
MFAPTISAEEQFRISPVFCHQINGRFFLKLIISQNGYRFLTAETTIVRGSAL